MIAVEETDGTVSIGTLRRLRKRLIAILPEYRNKDVRVLYSPELHSVVQELPGFVPAEDYTTKQETLENETGFCERFIFVQRTDGVLGVNVGTI